MVARFQGFFPLLLLILLHLSCVRRYSKAEQKKAMVKLEDMIKLQRKAQDQIKRLVRDVTEMGQCIQYSRNVGWSCVSLFESI